MPRQPKPAPAEPDDVLTTIRLPAPLHAALKQRAAQEDRSIAATVRRACALYVEDGGER